METANHETFHEKNVRRLEEYYEISKKNRLRLCKVTKRESQEKAIFHKWVEERQLQNASPMIGGHPGGEIASTLGIVEYKDGKVEKVFPEQIRFLDTDNYWPNKEINTSGGKKMASIYIKMKNGEMKKFEHEGRAGGSYTKSIRYEGAFAIVRDEWGDETAIPAADIEEVRTKQERYW